MCRPAGLQAKRRWSLVQVGRLRVRTAPGPVRALRGTCCAIQLLNQTPGAGPKPVRDAEIRLVQTLYRTQTGPLRTTDQVSIAFKLSRSCRPKAVSGPDHGAPSVEQFFSQPPSPF